MGEIAIDTLVLGIKIQERVGNNNPIANEKEVRFKDMTVDEASSKDIVICTPQNKVLHTYAQVVKGQKKKRVNKKSKEQEYLNETNFS